MGCAELKIKRLGRLVILVLRPSEKIFGWAEDGAVSAGDGDDFAGLGVLEDSGSSLVGVEGAEAAQLDALCATQCVAHLI